MEARYRDNIDNMLKRLLSDPKGRLDADSDCCLAKRRRGVPYMQIVIQLHRGCTPTLRKLSRKHPQFINNITLPTDRLLILFAFSTRACNREQLPTLPRLNCQCRLLLNLPIRLCLK